MTFLLPQIRETFFIAYIIYEMLYEQRNDACQWFVISSGMCLKHVNLLQQSYTRVECPHLFWIRTETGPEPSALLDVSAPRWASYVFAFSRLRVDLEGRGGDR